MRDIISRFHLPSYSRLPIARGPMFIKGAIESLKCWMIYTPIPLPLVFKENEFISPIKLNPDALTHKSNLNLITCKDINSTR